MNAHWERFSLSVVSCLIYDSQEAVATYELTIRHTNNNYEMQLKNIRLNI